MRRFKQALSEERTKELLKEGTSGVLSLNGDDGYPYGVPLSYVYDGSTIYFHSAMQGYKVDLMRANPKASFCVIADDTIVPEKYTTYFRSVIVKGTIRFIETREEQIATMTKLAMKYSADYKEGITAEMESTNYNFLMIALDVEELSGKEAIEYVNGAN